MCLSRETGVIAFSFSHISLSVKEAQLNQLRQKDNSSLWPCHPDTQPRHPKAVPCALGAVSSACAHGGPCWRGGLWPATRTQSWLRDPVGPVNRPRCACPADAETQAVAGRPRAQAAGGGQLLMLRFAAKKYFYK